MKGRRLSAEEMDARREIMLETAFRLFTEKNIDSVTMGEIAAVTGFTTRSLQRYFYSKENLVVAVSTWAWENYLSVNREGSPEKTGTAAETYEFMVDSFIGLYRDNVNILRFNQLFNVYVRSQRISSEQMQAFIAMIDAIKARFHLVYLRGGEDGTLRTDYSEEEIFSTTLHLMLAIATRYAVGLVYDAGVSPERELIAQKEMLLARYTK
ncbi:MAG: TetR/AcrR family transcriptional regulator [Oscillospiraceae bacterium]|nr:TetR/AcrR family transcriptional regulator [Oscillospiraceae bacterium]